MIFPAALVGGISRSGFVGDGVAAERSSHTRTTLLYAGTFNREIEGPAFVSKNGGTYGLVAGQNRSQKLE